MPESVTDRPTKAHEYVFLLTKQPRYWFDTEAVREPNVSPEQAEHNVRYAKHYDLAVVDAGQNNSHSIHSRGTATGRNVRSVWQIATQPYPEAHFATFPEELARRCILAGCPVRVCRVCGKPSERIVDVEKAQPAAIRPKDPRVHLGASDKSTIGQSNWHDGRTRTSVRTPIGWASCMCVMEDGTNKWRPGLVLDPFVGSGTTAKVARDHQRHAIGIDLNESYLELAARRLQQLSLLT